MSLVSTLRHTRDHWLLYAVATILVAGGITAAILFAFRPTSPFSGNVKQQVSYVIFYPPKSAGLKVDKSSINYNSSTKVLTFNATADGNQLAFSEQAAPDQFTDIPQYLPRLTQLLNTYTSFNSALGNVYLTRPSELKGSQSALFVGAGTMTFVHPRHDLSDDFWRRFFNTLSEVK